MGYENPITEHPSFGDVFWRIGYTLDGDWIAQMLTKEARRGLAETMARRLFNGDDFIPADLPLDMHKPEFVYTEFVRAIKTTPLSIINDAATAHFAKVAKDALYPNQT